MSSSLPTIGYLTYTPYFDNHTHRYYNVICINSIISGPLEPLICVLNIPPISEYKHRHPSHTCNYVIKNNFSSIFPYYTLDQLNGLFIFMKQNNYVIQSDFYSQHIPLAQNTICMFSYSGAL